MRGERMKKICYWLQAILLAGLSACSPQTPNTSSGGNNQSVSIYQNAAIALTTDNENARLIQTENSTLSQFINTVKPRTVQLVSLNNGNRTPLGTGFLLNNDGYVITAGHLLDPVWEHLRQPTGGAFENLVIVVTPPNGSDLRADPPINGVFFISRDRQHDLALLKLQLQPFLSFYGETIWFVNYGDGSGSKLNVGNAQFANNISQNSSIGVIGYFLNHTNPQTTAGNVISGKKPSTLSSTIASNSGLVTFNISDYYATNVLSNTITSGSPVFSTLDGTLLGMAVNVIQSGNNTGTTVIIPGQYISDLLNKSLPK